MTEKHQLNSAISAEAQIKADLRYGQQVVLKTVVVNAALSILKLLAGIFAHSAAMISDAVHSASDMLISLFVLLGLGISRKNADPGHPYGHEKLESAIAIFMSLLLAAVALGMGYGALESLRDHRHLAAPGIAALLAALTSIAVKEWMYHYTLQAGRRLKSSSMEADAWHHRSDALSSIGSLLGIGGAMLGLPLLDPLAAFLICLLILKVAYNLGKTAFAQLVDSAAPAEVIAAIERLIAADRQIMKLDDLKTRQHGSKIYVDVEITVSHLLTLTEAHDIAENLHEKIEAANSDIKHCMVHVNPSKTE